MAALDIVAAQDGNTQGGVLEVALGLFVQQTHSANLSPGAQFGRNQNQSNASTWTPRNMVAFQSGIAPDQLKAKLTPLQYKVTQEKYTEKPRTGRFDRFHEAGTYSCVVCREELFTSALKYESGCGWPAFFDSIDKSKISIEKDFQLIGDDLELLKRKPHLVRNEILCAKCRSHLGHIFDDGPEPTKKRYCVNSASLIFKPQNASGDISDDGTDEPDRDIDVCCRD